MNEKELDEANVLASIHGEYIRITPPVEGETQFVTDMKMFLFACLARRNMDQDFAGNMQDWINKTSSDDVEMHAQLIKLQ